jgi:hypothetical protein
VKKRRERERERERERGKGERVVKECAVIFFSK